MKMKKWENKFASTQIIYRYKQSFELRVYKLIYKINRNVNE